MNKDKKDLENIHTIKIKKSYQAYTNESDIKIILLLFLKQLQHLSIILYL